MERLQRDAVLITLLERIKQENRVCSESYIQKMCYLFEGFFSEPLGFSFQMYKHAPFSWDLQDELTALRADDILEIKVNRTIGATEYVLAENSGLLKQLHIYTIAKNAPCIEFIIREFAQYKIPALEKLATALYVMKENPENNLRENARKIRDYTPHVTREEALDALLAVDFRLKEKEELFGGLYEQQVH